MLLKNVWKHKYNLINKPMLFTKIPDKESLSGLPKNNLFYLKKIDNITIADGEYLMIELLPYRKKYKLKNRIETYIIPNTAEYLNSINIQMLNKKEMLLDLDEGSELSPEDKEYNNLLSELSKLNLLKIFIPMILLGNLINFTHFGSFELLTMILTTSIYFQLRNSSLGSLNELENYNIPNGLEQDSVDSSTNGTSVRQEATLENKEALSNEITGFRTFATKPPQTIEKAIRYNNYLK